jgi:FdhD protein
VRPSSVPWTVTRSTGRQEPDQLAAEEPLEIRLNGRSLVVTMRTPGADEELALGFLVNEGILRPEAAPDCPVAVVQNPLDPAQGNIVSVRATPEQVLRHPDARSFHASSACGVCGQASLDDMKRHFHRVESAMRMPRRALVALPDAMREAQSLFDQTGALHAAALFDGEGKLLALREDVGRHNALDKAAGWALRARRFPLHDAALLVSGRAGYEIVQKAVASGIPIVAAVGAPSSLAARLAEQANVTLVGFLRGDSFNVYAHPERIA